MNNHQFAEKVMRFLFITMGSVIALTAVTTCWGVVTTPYSSSTSDYVRNYGLPPDPYDRTPPANR